MSRIDRYLLQESVPPLFFGLVVYVGVVVISSAVPLIEWIVGAPVPIVLEWFALQVPAAVLRSLPVSLVLAALMAIGRLAADNELVALRAGGIGVLRTARWFFIVGAIAAGLALGLEQWAVPVSSKAAGATYSTIIDSSVGLYTVVGKRAALGNVLFRFRSLDRSSGTMKDVELQQWDGKRLTLVRAREAHFSGRDLVLTGYSVYGFDFGALGSSDGSTPSDKFVRLANTPSDPGASLTITLGKAERAVVQQAEADAPKPSRSVVQAWSDSHDSALPVGERHAAAVDFHRMLSEPFANLTLLLVAIPLALLYTGSRAVAFGLSLVVTMIWYVLLTLGQLSSQTGALPVWLGPWLGNLVLGVVGVYLLAWRVRLR